MPRPTSLTLMLILGLCSLVACAGAAPRDADTTPAPMRIRLVPVAGGPATELTCDDAARCHLPVGVGIYRLEVGVGSESVELLRRITEPSPTLDLLMSAPQVRPVDTDWNESECSQPHAERAGILGFALDTSGDQFMNATEVGLVVWVERGNRRHYRTVLSCAQAGFGEPPPENGRAVADCDGRSVELLVLDGTIVVRDGDNELASLPLPEGSTVTFPTL